MDGWVGGWMDGWVDGWVDGWMDGWMEVVTRPMQPISMHILNSHKSG